MHLVVVATVAQRGAGLINEAKAVHTARKFAEFKVDTAAILARVRAISESIYQHETPEVLEQAGAIFVTGPAIFESAKIITVNERRFQGKKIMIATGSSPLVPPIPGLDTVPYLTNEHSLSPAVVHASSDAVVGLFAIAFWQRLTSAKVLALIASQLSGAAL